MTFHILNYSFYFCKSIITINFEEKILKHNATFNCTFTFICQFFKSTK